MRSRSERIFGIGLVGLIAALPFVAGSIAVANQVIVSDTAHEDLYAVADAVIVEGTVEGDIFVITGKLTITGTVDVAGSGVPRRPRARFFDSSSLRDGVAPAWMAPCHM